MHRGYSGIAPAIIGDVLADSDDAIGTAQASGADFTRESAVGSERQSERRARQIDDAAAEGDFEEKLRGIVGGGQRNFGLIFFELLLEVGAQTRVRRHANVDGVSTKLHDAFLNYVDWLSSE